MHMIALADRCLYQHMWWIRTSLQEYGPQYRKMSRVITLGEGNTQSTSESNIVCQQLTSLKSIAKC